MINRNAHDRFKIVANTLGILFAVMFSFLFWTAAYLSQGPPITPIEITIFILYPSGLIIGIKRKGLGGLTCIVGFVTALVLMILRKGLFAEFDYILYVFVSLVQMIPVILYVFLWNHNRRTRVIK